MHSLFVWAGMIAAVGLCCTMYSFLFITENVINLWSHNHSPQGSFGWILYLCSTHSPLSENMNFACTQTSKIYGWLSTKQRKHGPRATLALPSEVNISGQYFWAQIMRSRHTFFFLCIVVLQNNRLTGYILTYLLTYFTYIGFRGCITGFPRCGFSLHLFIGFSHAVFSTALFVMLTFVFKRKLYW